jgi:hypothetical protein
MSAQAAAERGRLRARAQRRFRALLLLLALPKLLSLLVPRSRRIVLVGARGSHLDNVLGLLLARPGPAPGVKVRVLASPKNLADGRLAAAVAALPGARIVRESTPAALWWSLRARWVLVPNLKHEDAHRFWLGRARLVYCNHGPWIKRMAPPYPTGRRAELGAWLFGRFRLALASHDGEVADYQAWFGPGVHVASFGYPRAAYLDGLKATFADRKVGLWPTWKRFDDDTYDAALAGRVHARVFARRAGCVEFRPHHLSGQEPAMIGEPRPGRPSVVVTDFSSVAFDQYYLGGRVLLYSKALAPFLAERGVRPAMEDWMRRHLIEDEETLLATLAKVVEGRAAGTPDPLHLRPFDSAAFWAWLEAH